MRRVHTVIGVLITEEKKNTSFPCALFLRSGFVSAKCNACTHMDFVNRTKHNENQKHTLEINNNDLRWLCEWWSVSISLRLRYATTFYVSLFLTNSVSLAFQSLCFQWHCIVPFRHFSNFRFLLVAFVFQQNKNCGLQVPNTIITWLILLLFGRWKKCVC